MLRLTEPDEGKIMVDGVDLSGIKLYNLRSAIAVIPQDPVLFQGIPFKGKIGVIRLCII